VLLDSAYDDLQSGTFLDAENEARRFIAGIDPDLGQAVVEVGAGSGRLALDGEMIWRVGAKGQYLVTGRPLAFCRGRRLRRHRHSPGSD